MPPKKTAKIQKFVTRKELNILSLGIGRNIGQLRKQIDKHSHDKVYAVKRHTHDETYVTEEELKRGLKMVEKNYFKTGLVRAVLFTFSLAFLFLGLLGLSIYWAFGVIGVILFFISFPKE